ncbi:MAG TPA: hypothetical protein VEZ90_02610 [Blastocatellia bacterium]|nr:hypothetical protein [Blastocatellia bacterium]
MAFDKKCGTGLEQSLCEQRRKTRGNVRRNLFNAFAFIQTGIVCLSATAVFLGLINTACARRPAASASTSPASTESSSSKGTPASSGSPGTPESSPAPTPTANNGLVGTYSISEVENKGAIELIDPKKAQVTFAFFPDGSYARSTRNRDQIIYSDGGNVRFDGPGQLTLVTTIENRSILKEPHSKSYKYELSSDGQELKLWGTNERVAVFKKADKKSGQKE